MGTFKLSLGAVMAITVLFSGCSQMEVEQKVVTFKQNVSVTDKDGKRTVKAGETTVLKEDPLLVESPGRLGLLLIPLGDPPGNMEVELSEMNKMELSELQFGLVNRNLDRLLEKIYEVQVLLSVKKGTVALEKLQALKAEFPGVQYLKFLEASVLFVMGRYVDSKALLEEVLVESGQNEKGKALFLLLNRALSGKGGEDSPSKPNILNKPKRPDRRKRR